MPWKFNPFTGALDYYEPTGAPVGHTHAHSALTGLGADDHTHYALADKTRPNPWVAAADLAARSLGDLGTRTHSLLTGLGADDHTLYALADKTRPNPWVAASDLAARSLADLGTRSHADLQNLTTGDPHTQYVATAGRSGTSNDFLVSTTTTGTITGSAQSGAGKRLNLRASTDTQGIATISIADHVTLAGFGNSVMNVLQGPLDLNASTRIWAMSVADLNGTHGTWTATANLLSGFGGGFQAFVIAPTVRNTASAARSDMGTWQLFLNAIQFIGDGAAITVPNVYSIFDNVQYKRENAGSTTCTEHTSVRTAVSADTSCSITTLRGHHLIANGLGGSFGTVVVYDIDSGVAASTLALSLRSGPAAMQMRHAGGVRIGSSTAAPDTQLHLTANTLRAAITFDEDTATPSNPTSGAQCRLYMKADKLVIQYNDAGTIRYKYLDLTGTGVTWVHTTSAP
jgi:hypothetical protein